MAGMEDDRSAGRPRDASIDERALTVARELLVEMGWDGLSYEAALLLTAATPTDDSATLADLDLTWRSPVAAIIASFQGTPQRS